MLNITQCYNDSPTCYFDPIYQHIFCVCDDIATFVYGDIDCRFLLRWCTSSPPSFYGGALAARAGRTGILNIEKSMRVHVTRPYQMTRDT